MNSDDIRLARKSTRRDWLRLACAASTGAAVYLLTGNSKPLFAQSPQGDIGILTAALYLEQEAIAAYQAGAESKLLSPGILSVAVAFQSDHKYHRDGIGGGLKSLGVEPAGPEKKYNFGHLKNRTGHPDPGARPGERRSARLRHAGVEHQDKGYPRLRRKRAC